jgi:hypothetical protein
MSKRGDYGLEPIIERHCINCNARLVLRQRWIHGEPQQPPPCPACNNPCQQIDDGARVKYGQHYVQGYRVEITSARLAAPDETTSSDFYMPDEGPFG